MCTYNIHFLLQRYQLTRSTTPKCLFYMQFDTLKKLALFYVTQWEQQIIASLRITETAQAYVRTG